MSMTMTRKSLTVLFVLGLGIGFPVLASLGAQVANTLVAKQAAAAPTLDGAVDEAWKRAPALSIKVIGGKNLPGGSTEATLRALYAGDTVYFLLQYKDPTDSVRRLPWQKQADASWLKLSDPGDKGSDDNMI